MFTRSELSKSLLNLASACLHVFLGILRRMLHADIDRRPVLRLELLLYCGFGRMFQLPDNVLTGYMVS